MYMYFSMFVVHGTVKMTTNYEGVKDGPCPGEPIIVSCSAVGQTLRWTVTDTSLELTSLNSVTFTATSSDIGRQRTISTNSTILKFYQNETVENTTHRSNSKIYSEMHFYLDVDEFVAVTCTDHNQENSEKIKVTSFGTYMYVHCTYYCKIASLVHIHVVFGCRCLHLSCLYN